MNYKGVCKTALAILAGHCRHCRKYALCVVNGLKGKSQGLITRKMSTVNGVEKSFIDFVIVNSELIKHVESIHINDSRTND